MTSPSPLTIAQEILAVPRTESSWECVLDNEDLFIWDENGDQVHFWNLMYGPEAGLAAVDEESAHEGLFYSYQGNRIHVPIRDKREDDLIMLHVLNRLVRNDTELRFLIDSHGSSTHAFSALRPAEWQALEAQFGKVAVDFRYQVIADDLDSFIKEIWWTDHSRDYGDSGSPGESKPRADSILEKIFRMFTGK